MIRLSRRRPPMALLFLLALLGAAGLALTADTAQGTMAWRGALVALALAGLLWWIAWILGSLVKLLTPRRSRSPLVPRSSRPGRGGMPDAARMRRDLGAAILAAQGPSREPGVPPAPRAVVGDLVQHGLNRRLQGARTPKGTRSDGAVTVADQLAALTPEELATEWAVLQALGSDAEGRAAALARFRDPTALDALLRGVDAARAAHSRHEAEARLLAEAFRRWEREGAVDPGEVGLLGFLQREAPDDPAFWHQVLCGLESPVPLDLLRWLLTRPGLDAGSLAFWLGHEAELGYLPDTVIRAAKAGDGTLEALRAAIERWNAGGVRGPVWATSEEPLGPNVLRAWRRAMEKAAASLGEVPLPEPVGLFEAATVPAPAPRVPYRYSHRDGLTTPPPRREDVLGGR